MQNDGMYSDETPEELPGQEHRSSRRRRHEQEVLEHEHRHRSRHAHYEEEPRPPESAWDRNNWLFLLVLTNFISLAVGTHIGHRHWDDLKVWMGQSEHASSTTPQIIEPSVIDRP